MNPIGPYVTVATLCETVLDEKDGRISLVRILDRVEINRVLSRPLRVGEELPTLPTPALQATGLLVLKSGDFIGKKLMRIQVFKPSGELMKMEDEGAVLEPLPLFFEGGEHGIQIILKLSLKIEMEGLYL